MVEKSLKKYTKPAWIEIVCFYELGMHFLFHSFKSIFIIKHNFDKMYTAHIESIKSLGVKAFSN